MRSTQRSSRRALAQIGAAGLLLLVCACSPSRSELPVDVHIKVSPSPPSVGPSIVELTVTGPEGPLRLVGLHVEGNMNHPGMSPSEGVVSEMGDGRYRAALDFTMGGDWYLLVSGTTHDGRTFESAIDVPGVAGRR